MLAKFLAVARQQIFGLLALFVALGGTSYAVATGSIDSREIKNNTVRSKDIRNNQVRSGDVRNGSLLNRDFRRGQLPAGPQGPEGPRGLPGQNATKLFAYIEDNGPDEAASVRYGSGVTGVTDEPDNSRYHLRFNRSLVGCVVHATAGQGDPAGIADSSTGVPHVRMGFGASNTVRISFTLAGPSGGVPQDTSFMVTAFCR